MADLIAEGKDPQHRWRRPLPVGQKLLLGRSAGIWAVPWDDRISRRHAEIIYHDGTLSVERLATSRNPIYLRGQETNRFELRSGEHFVIGQTKFTLTDDRAQVSLDLRQPLREQSFSSQYLQHVQFRNADQRIEVLSRLPDVISGATDDHELYVRLVNLMLTGVARASAVALVNVEVAADGTPAVSVMHWDRRAATGTTFQPSERLILRAVRRAQSVLHVWGLGGGSGDGSVTALTMMENFDWAFCVPVKEIEGRGLGIYVAGQFIDEAIGSTNTPPSDANDLRDDLKFAELVAAILSSLRQVKRMQRQHASLSQFFAPAVLDALVGEDPEVVLRPRETDVTVLFCDLRGFSLRAEQSEGDLLGLLNRVSLALGVMTHHILDQGGVVGDYQGDAAMGFWGWPLAQADATERACRAALAIRAEFEAAARRPEDPLSKFQVGIGIASGRAVAGKIGTLEQVKVTVFGPVVNLASRLEGMTKILQVPILMDDITSDVLRGQVSREVARCRRLAVVKPYGLDRSLTVCELLPPADQYPRLSDEHITAYEAALDALLAGRWAESYQLLHHVPPDDRAKDFLMVYIARHNREVPPDWSGFIQLQSKS
ncbi:MAG: adenylate/guanylate cyclase domain-containing protein [Pirellulales bacterium]|nr:adenylate/guanylate cyclase domain-containing protein [Pirellulales bacterium]